MASKRPTRPLVWELEDVADWVRRLTGLGSPSASHIGITVLHRAAEMSRQGRLLQSTVQSLCDDAGLKPRALKYALKALEGEGLLSRGRRRAPDGTNMGSVIAITLPDDAEADELGVSGDIRPDGTRLAPARAGPAAPTKEQPEHKAPADPGRLEADDSPETPGRGSVEANPKRGDDSVIPQSQTRRRKFHRL